MKNAMKRAVSILLCIAMLCSLCAGLASAAEAESYVPIGDSITLDFLGYYSDEWGPEWDDMITATYGDQFAAKYGYTVDTAVQYPGLRSTDTYYLLTDAYEGDDYTQRMYGSWFRAGSTVKADAQKAIRNTSVISMQVGYCNFACYVLTNLMAMIGLKDAFDTDLSQLMATPEWAEVSPYIDNVMGLYEDFLNSSEMQTLKSTWKTLSQSAALPLLGQTFDENTLALLEKAVNAPEALYDTMKYAVASLMVDLSRSVTRIHELNPDATIYLMGLANMAHDMKLTYNVGLMERELNLGDMIQQIFDTVNRYYEEFAKKDELCIYVQNAKTIERGGDQLEASAEKTRLLLETFFRCEGVADYAATAEKVTPAMMRLLSQQPFNLNEIVLAMVQSDVQGMFSGGLNSVDAILTATQTDSYGNLTSTAFEQFVGYCCFVYALSSVYIHPTQNSHNAMAAALFAAVKEAPFELALTDVPAGAYYEEAVRWAVLNGVTAGTGDTTFSPDAPCTRAQMVTFLWRAAGCPEPGGDYTPFEDVSADDYFAKAVAWAYFEEITAGKTETEFSPNTICTRAQMVAFLYRSQKQEAVRDTVSFEDVPDDAYYREAVIWAVENGVTEGTSATTFSPDDVCTRAQGVTFLYRIYQ